MGLDPGHSGPGAVLFIAAIVLGGPSAAILMIAFVFVRRFARVLYGAAVMLLVFALLTGGLGFFPFLFAAHRFGDPFVMSWWMALALLVSGPYLRGRRFKRS